MPYKTTKIFWTMRGDERIDLILEKYNELNEGQEYLKWRIDKSWNTWADVTEKEIKTVNEWMIAQGAVEGEDVLIDIPQG